MTAITHVPSPVMEQCELTYIQRESIDYNRAVLQHRSYREAIHSCGVDVIALDVNRTLPDCVFIEDVAVVLNEVAILAFPGTPSRQPEPAGIEPTLREYREIRRLSAGATLEGGDVLRIGRTLLVGQSSRTNTAGIESFRDIVRPFGYRVLASPIHGCLHLKTSCTALPDGRLLINPDWINVSALTEFNTIHVPADEPWGANVLLIGQKVCLAASHVQTAAMIHSLGFATVPLDISEFAKAEGGVTCLSILFE